MCSAALLFHFAHSESLLPTPQPANQLLTNNRAEWALGGAVIARKVDDYTLVDALCDVFSGAPLPARSF